MQRGHAVFRHGFAELIERDLLPLLNLMVLLLPIVLLGIELVTRSAMSVTLPDPSPDVASLDTPAAPRPRGSRSDDHAETRSHSVPPRAWIAPDPTRAAVPTPAAASVFSDSPLGYGD